MIQAFRIICCRMITIAAGILSVNFGLQAAVLAPQASGGMDESLVKMVPDEFLAVSIWDYSQAAPPDSSNRSDQLLAEPAVRRFIDSVQAIIFKMAQTGADELPPELKNDVQQFVEFGIPLLLRGTGGLILKDFQLEGEELVSLEAIAILQTGQRSERVLQSVLNLIGNALGPAETAMIGSTPAHRFSLDPSERISLVVGVSNGFLMVATSDEIFQSTITRMNDRSVSPTVQELFQLISLDRRSSFSYIHIGRLQAKLIDFVPPEVKSLLVSLGLDSVKSYYNSTGYNETMTTNRTLFQFDGPPRGMFAMASDRGLEAADLAHIPSDALFAFAASIDAKAWFSFFLQQLEEIEPQQAAEIKDMLDTIRRNTQVDIRNSLIDQMGPVISLHNAAGDGWLSGLVLSVQLKDAEIFANALFRLQDTFINDTRGYADAPKFINRRIGDVTLSTLVVPDAPFPFEISFSVDQDRFLVSLFPQTIVSLITESPQPLFAGELPTASGSSADSSDSLQSIFWIDTQKAFESFYPMVQMMFAMRHQIADDLPAELAAAVSPLIRDLTLPPARTIHKHLGPTISTVHRTSLGIVVETQQTLPAIDPTLMGPIAVAMLLPAVQQARMAARRAQSMNNLRQIALAMLNYESAYRSFPSGFGAGVQDGPAVSWRVLILPFLDEMEIYEMYRMDEPWDSEHNLKVLERMPEVYRSPTSQTGPYETNYRVIGGRNGIFGKDENGNAIRPRLGQIIDGTSNTILAVEVGDHTAVPWTKPDEGIDPDNFSVFDFLGQYPGGFLAGMADGSVHFIKDTISADRLKALFEKNDGRIVSPYDD